MVSMPLRPSISSAERRWLLWTASFVLTLTLLPYMLCTFAAIPDRVFTGFLINPVDGFSYLAKMRMGWEGKWIFHLPFTLEQGQGTFIFSYYLLLGHLARLFSLPLIVVFSIARIVNGFILLWIAYRLIAHVTDVISLRKLMWWLVALSSGLGWLVQKFGLGYSYYYHQAILGANVFYGLLVSVHSLLAMAIMLLMFLQVLKERSFSLRNIMQLGILSLLLAVINPFTPLVVYIISGATLVTIGWRDRSFPRSQFMTILIAGLMTTPLWLYMHYAIQADPTLRAFSTQNINLTPPPLGLLLSYGLLWLFMIPGMQSAWQRKSDWDILLIVWIVITVPMLYVPYSLQYRFALGLHIPIAILAAQGLSQIIRANWPRRLVVATLASTSLYIVSSLIISKASVSTAVVHYPLTYISKYEATALNWLQTNVPSNKAVLAGPEMGLFIPAFAGQRVVYGHLYETVEASRKYQLVQDFFAGKVNQADVLRNYAIDYVLIGPRERALGAVDPTSLPLRLVFTSGDVSVYQVEY